LRGGLIDSKEDVCQLQIAQLSNIRVSASSSKGMKLMPDAPISRGFKGRRPDEISKTRLPPGQYVTRDFPVMAA
jgi:hypothetical protein